MSMRDEHAGKLAVLLATAEGGYSGRGVGHSPR
jgi:hypothetical protein